jgi:eukaryotic-like serine/threonine-protein kinase
LSYAREDAEAARRVAEVLRAAGIEVWFDETELRGGDTWDAKIRREIRECALFLPIISHHTNLRLEGYFRREWKQAVDRTEDMAEEKPFLVPIVIDETPEGGAFVPDRFRRVQWTRLPAGFTTPQFAERVRALLAGSPSIPLPSDHGPEVAMPHPRHHRRWAMPVAIATVILALGATIFLFVDRQAKARTIRARAMPEIRRLIDKGDNLGAFALARQMESDLKDEPEFVALWSQMSQVVSITTNPPGVEVSVKGYRRPDLPWQPLGRSPVANVRLARDFYRWEFRRPDAAPIERARAVEAELTFDLTTPEPAPPGMIFIRGGSTPVQLAGLEHMPAVILPSYFVDRYEVTNAEFRKFVDAGGYANPAFWKIPFVKDGREITWAEAVAGFTDSTSKPGPATWADGKFSPGAENLPVTGISWFEAVAYAESVGKRLPSIQHWARASNPAQAAHVVPLSNFSGRELSAVGKYAGVSAWGAYDMAGNAREWCWNEADPGKRYLRGGSWRDADYLFAQQEAQSPFDRSAVNGFRCIKLLGDTVVPPEADVAVIAEQRDFDREPTVNDETFRLYQSLFAYDQSDLGVRLESTTQDEVTRVERISVNAPYGGERMPILLYIPRHQSRHQPIIYFPGSGAATTLRTSERLDRPDYLRALTETGRMVVVPIYKSTYERNDGLTSTYPNMTVSYRDHYIQWTKDIRRTIDYLETRADVQKDKIAFLGVSWGARIGTTVPAVEPRIKVNVLISPGFRPQRALPEVDQINFVPRVTIPTLMLNGRYDYIFPHENSQLPLFRRLGTPSEHKRQMIYDAGHLIPISTIATEITAWLDRYLGKVDSGRQP